MKYCVNNEGVEALNNLVSEISLAIAMLKEEVYRISGVTSEYQTTLGPHVDTIESCLQDIADSVNKASEPAESIAQITKQVAERYQEIIDKNVFGNSSSGAGGQSSGAGSSGSSSSSGSGGSWSSGSDPNKFGPYDVGVFKNGGIMVKGDNYDKFYNDYYNGENSTLESLGDKEYVEVIPPSSIEGISIGPKEQENSGIFWSQHDSDGTADSFKAIADKIPTVSSMLSEGKSLSEIRQDPSLEKCVSIYFDPSNMVKVEKWGDYYVFNANGRHRILAARDKGFNIPVKVIGIRRW